MADANGKLPSGFITGTKTDFGSYEECLSLKVDSNNESESFKGQFCMMGLQSHLMTFPGRLTPDGRTYEDAYGPPPNWIAVEMENIRGLQDEFALNLGICAPSVCSQEDIHNILKAVTKPAELKVSVEDCHTDEPKKLPTYATMTLAFLSCWLGVILLGTALDVFDRICGNVQTEHRHEGVGKQMLKAFSLYTNTEKLLDTKCSEGPLGYLFGLRFIICEWVLFGHIIFFNDYWRYQRFSNMNRVIKLMTLDTRISESGSLVPSIFLVISGFLMICNPSKRTGEKPKIKESFLKNIFKKYMRLMSPMIFLFLITFVIPFLYNGPIWNTSLDYEVKKCRNYGWRNLLFIHNIYNNGLEEICWSHTWYISAAIQIQIASILLLALIERFSKTGITVGFLAVFGCHAYVASIAYQNEYTSFSPLVIRSKELINSVVANIYMKPFMHFSSHVIGMIAGYITKKYPRPLPMVYQIIGWIFFIIALTSAFYVQWWSIPVEIIMLFIALTRNSVFAAGWAWFMYALTTNQGTLSKFLSWKPFVPLGKLSFSFYMFHALAMTVKIASGRERMFLGRVSMGIDFLALSVSTFLIAFIAFIAVETPISVLCNIWDGKGSSPSLSASTYVKNENTSTKDNISESENISKKKL